jgi:hypothetical protein
MRRPKAVSEGTEDSFGSDNATTESNPGFVKRKPGYPLTTESRSAVNIDWTSDSERRSFQGRVPRAGYDINNPTTRVTIPNWDITLDKPSTVVPQTSHIPIISITYPLLGASIAAGSTITIKADTIEYASSAQLDIDNVFVEKKSIAAVDRGSYKHTFMFSYTIPVSKAGSSMVIKLSARGVHSEAAGFFIYKNASTGNINGVKKGIWSSTGTTEFIDFAINGYEQQTAPDFLAVDPSDTAEISVNII